MSKYSKLGLNIQSLRIAFGESQEDLGDVLGIGKNTVSYYENGRVPQKKYLDKIAKHYMVTVEELSSCDFSSIGTIKIDQDAFWKNIDIVLPVISSSEALTNNGFKMAFDAHKAFYNKLHKKDMSGIEELITNIDGYIDALENDIAKFEASVNFLAFWFLLMFLVKTAPWILINKPAQLMWVASRNSDAKRLIEESDDSTFESDMRDALNEITDEDKKLILKILNELKASKCYSNLADYYLALQYFWGIVDNDLDMEFNRRIGIEMMSTFSSVNNIYATRFMVFSIDSMFEKSSQSVDDK